MNYWEIFADNLSKAGRNWGYVSRFNEVASVFVCLDHVARRIVNTNHRIGSSGEGKNSAAFQRR